MLLRNEARDTAGTNCRRKIPAEHQGPCFLASEVSRALLLYWTTQNSPVCWAQGRTSPGFFFLGSVVAATTWQEHWQVPALAASLSLRTTDGSGFLFRGTSSQKGLSVGKTCRQRWSSASYLSAEGTLRDCHPLPLPQQWLS